MTLQSFPEFVSQAVSGQQVGDHYAVLEQTLSGQK